jgi:hypothetical protein
MTFTTRPYLKFLLPLPIIFGVAVLFWTYQDFSNKTDQQQQALAWLTIIVIVFFFLLPYFSFKYLKTIQIQNGKWTVHYPYKRKSISFDKKTVLCIEIIYNVSGRYIPSYTQTNIKLNNSKTIYINSLETNSFENYLKLIKKDFRNQLVESDFWKGKVQNS